MHCLLDVKYLDVKELAVKWGALVGQAFAIVHIKDVREQQYCHEVTKYVCKPAEMVAWPPEQIADFINTIDGIRCFSVFGSLFKLGREIRRELAAQKTPPPVCTCGCMTYTYEDEKSAILGQIRREKRR